MIQLIASGIIYGCIYGLAALGFVAIYRTTDIVNFSQGEMGMIIAFTTFFFYSSLQLHFYVSAFLGLIVSIVLGYLTYLLFIRPIRDAEPIIKIVLTLGLFMIFSGLAGMIWGHTPTSFPKVVDGAPIKILGAVLEPNEIFIVIFTFALAILLYVLFHHTKLGLAMRSVSQNTFTSRLMGIKLNQVYIVTWGLGGLLAGIAGILIAPSTFLHPNMMGEVLIMAFAAAILGGFTSMPGALIGGVIIGVVSNLISYYIGPEMRVAIIFLIIVLILLFRPTGLFGERQLVKKV